MTRKDYELIAQILREDAAHLPPIVRRGPEDEACDMVRGEGWILPRADALAMGLIQPFDYTNAPAWERGAYDQWSTTVLAFGRALQADNPRFDAERFYSATGFRHGAQRALDVDARSLANAADMGVYSEINPASDEEAE